MGILSLWAKTYELSDKVAKLFGGESRKRLEQKSKLKSQLVSGGPHCWRIVAQLTLPAWVLGSANP